VIEPAADEPNAVELAVVEEDVRVVIGSERE
jgi:hypothetical protein